MFITFKYKYGFKVYNTEELTITYFRAKRKQ